LARRQREVHLVASLPADAVLAMSTSIGTIASWFKRRGDRRVDQREAARRGFAPVVQAEAEPVDCPVAVTLSDIRRCPKDEDDAGRDDRGAA